MTNIFLFAVNEPRKNLFVQYHGFLIAKRENKGLTLHTNVVSDQPEIYINNYGWLPREQYNNIIKNSKLSLQVYPFESFSYQTVETILLGCLPIISPSVRDNLSLPREIVVWNIDSPIEIAKKINEIDAWPKEQYEAMLQQCQTKVKEITNAQNKYLKIILEKAFLKKQ